MNRTHASDTPADPLRPPRAVLARLNPDLTDSPLRRALAAAHLNAPFGIADGNDHTEQETHTP